MPGAGARPWEPQAAAFAQEGAFTAPLGALRALRAFARRATLTPAPVGAGDGRARHAQDRPPGADFYRAFYNGPQLAPPFAADPGAASVAETPPQRALAGCLQSFVASGRSGAPLSPAQLPDLGLSPADKVRARCAPILAFRSTDYATRARGSNAYATAAASWRDTCS